MGLATARQLLRKYPGAQVTVLEKESAPGQHQPGHQQERFSQTKGVTPGRGMRRAKA